MPSTLYSLYLDPADPNNICTYLPSEPLKINGHGSFGNTKLAAGVGFSNSHHRYKGQLIAPSNIDVETSCPRPIRSRCNKAA